MGPTLLTVSLVTLSTSIALVLGVTWGVSLLLLRHAEPRCGVDWTGWLSKISLLCMLATISLPLYVHAAGWESATGKFGWLPILRGGQRYWFHGFTAATWIHAGYGVGWIGLATLVSFQGLPASLWRAACMEANWWQRMRFVGVPLALPMIVAASLWVAMVAATEMTVADLYGVNTLADSVYKFYALEPESGPVMISVVVPLVILLPIVVYGVTRGAQVSAIVNAQFNALRSQDRRVRLEGSHDAKLNFGIVRRSWILAVSLFAITVVALVSGVPLLSLIVKAGWVVETTSEGDLFHTFSMQQFAFTLQDTLRMFSKEYYWSCQLVVFSILFSLPAGWLLAALSERRPNLKGAIWIGMLILVAIPGPVVSLVLIALFNRPSLSFFYDRTLLPALLALMTRCVPLAFMIMRAAYRRLDNGPMEAARMDGATVWLRLLTIDGPRLWRPVALAAMGIALITFADLSCTLLVLPPSVSTVATRIFGLLHSGVRYQESGLALVSAVAVWLLSAVGLKLASKSAY